MNLDAGRWYTISELADLIGGSDRLYRGEIAAGLLPAIFTGEWRIRGTDALEWATARAARRHGRARPRAGHGADGASAPVLASSFPKRKEERRG